MSTEQISSLQEFSEVSRNCCKESPIFTSKWYTAKYFLLLISFRLVLFSFSFLSCTNAMLWNTFSPVARIAERYFEVTSFAIDTFSFIYFAAYVVFVLPACWVIYRFPLNYSVIVGGGLINLFGSWIRLIGVYIPISPSSQYYIVLFGQFLASFAQCFILQVPPLISNGYFESNERAIATSIGFVWNQIGIAASFLLSPLIINDDTARIPLLLLVNASICTLSFLLLIFMVTGKKRVTEEKPIKSNESVTSHSILYSLLNRSFIVLVFAYGINMGVFFSFTTLLDKIIGYYRYSSLYTGWFGFSIIIVGLFGAFFSGFVLDKTKKFKEVLIVFYVGTALSVVLFGIFLNPKNEILVGIFCGAIGFFMSAIMPISFEASIEVTYMQVPEELNTGLMMMSSMVFGVIFLLVLNQFIIRQMMKDAIIFLSVTCYVAILLLFLFQPIYKRLESEKIEKNRNQEASIMIDSSIKNEDEENEGLTSSSSSFGDSI